MTNDEAVKYGAEAGRALYQALTDICSDKAEIAIRAAVLVMSSPALIEAPHDHR